MKKRYVFWRTPEGRPYRGDDSKYAPVAILAQLGETATVRADGKVEWTSSGPFRMQPAIRSAVAILGPDAEELNGTDAWEIFRPSIASVIARSGGGKPVLPQEVLREADVKAGEFFRKQPNRYLLITSLSVDALPSRRIRVRNCEVAALTSLGRFKPPPVLELHQHHGELPARRPEGWQLIRVSTTGRTVNEAASNALNELGLLRGLWTLYGTFGSWTLSSGPASTPVGLVHPGPIHTLHLPNGDAADDVYWYDSDTVVDPNVFGPTVGWTETEKRRRRAMRQLLRSKFRLELENLIVRYAVALDHANLDVALLQMWAVLERLTDTVGARYDETIRRAVWIFRDRSIAKEKLEGIRLRRNLFVHAARSADERDQLVNSIKSFVDPHLITLIRNNLAVSSLEEYATYLALPAALDALETQRKQRIRAIRFHKPPKK